MLSTTAREYRAERSQRAKGNAAYNPPVPCGAMATLPLCALTHGSPTLAWPEARNAHVWRLDLRDMGAGATSLLDSTETERAQRFVYAHDWRRYVAAHAWLRHILGAYLSVPPQQLRFAAGAYGKPVLLQAPRGAGQSALCFNMSHSKDLALIAVTSGIEVGVDIEVIREDLPGPDLAAGVLTVAERAELDALLPTQHAEAFVGCWVRKEASLKALGLGLNLDPRTLHLGLDHVRSHIRVRTRQPQATAPVARWDEIGEESTAILDVYPLPCPAGHSAALAAAEGLGDLQHFDAARLWRASGDVR